MFEKLLNRLKKQNPAHEIIPIVERMGNNALSIEYLRLAIEDPVEVSPEKYKIETLLKQKDNLYSRRAVLSNKFHECKDDADRREVSIAIKSIQVQIIAVRERIDTYYTTGELPAVVEKKLLPIDGRRQEKKLHSLRSSISRFKGLLAQTKDPQQIKHYERRIAELQSVAAELSA